MTLQRLFCLSLASLTALPPAGAFAGDWTGEKLGVYTLAEYRRSRDRGYSEEEYPQPRERRYSDEAPPEDSEYRREGHYDRRLRSQPRRSYRRSREISDDLLWGAAALAVPGSAFLLWTDPELDGRYIGPGSGIVLFLLSASFAIKAYVQGDFGLGAGIHGGSIVLGFAGHSYASRRRYMGPPEAGLRQPPVKGPRISFSKRF
jgi:hypothetical protein